MDYALITTAVTAVKGAHDVLRAALNLKVETEVSLKISDALQKLDSVQEAVFQAREDLFRLQKENDDLRRQIKERDEWDSVKNKYKLVETIRGGHVYQSIDSSPLHHACPRCFVKREIQILQPKLGDGWDRSECPACSQLYAITPESRTDSPRVESDFDPFR